MRTEICDRLGIDVPIFAFTHCRDVAAAVSNAGGLGVLGAVGFSPEQLEVELTWLDEHVQGVYGVDLVIPSKYEGKGVEGLSPQELEAQLAKLVPQGHRDFAAKILADHNVPELPADEQPNQLLGWTATTVAPQIDVILKHPKAKLVANALGTPPDDVIKQIQDSGRLIGALCGSVKHAMNHKNAGLDFVVMQGTEGGGHCGEVSSMVLWPQVVDAIGDIAGARRRWYRQRSSGRLRAGHGCAGRVDRFALADRRGGQCAARADADLHRRHQQRYRALAVLDR